MTISTLKVSAYKGILRLRLRAGFLVTAVVAALLPLTVMAQDNGLVPCRNDCDWEAFITMINGLIEWLIMIATSVAVLLFMYAGFLYLTSAGDESKVSQAKTIFLNTAIGFAIMLMAYLLVITLVSLLTGEGWLNDNSELLPLELLD
ncbi:MAG: hypothetical protein WD335_02660 [Candidatus Paceibacterota bacterium]